MKQKLISIIMANFNGEKYLPTCLNSVLNADYRNFELLIVDDSSTDRSIKIIEKFIKKDQRIVFTKNESNLGAAASRNKALTKAQGEIIVFLDNDTQVSAGWLNQLIIALDQEEVGAAQALLIDFEKRGTIQMGGGLLIPYVAWLRPFYQGDNYWKIKNRLKEKNIIGVSAALAVKRKTLNMIGGFDEKEAIYTEDLDFCWRVWISGFRIILAPLAVVYHYTKSVNMRKNMKASNLQIYYNLSKNSIRSMIKNYELKYLLINLPFSIAINLARGILVLLRRGDISALIGAVWGMIWNMIYIFDTLKNRLAVQRTRSFSDSYLFTVIFIENNLLEVYNNFFRKSKLLW